MFFVKNQKIANIPFAIAHRNAEKQQFGFSVASSIIYYPIPPLKINKNENYPFRLSDTGTGHSGINPLSGGTARV